MPLRQVPVLSPACAGSDASVVGPEMAKTRRPAFKMREENIELSGNPQLSNNVTKLSFVPEEAFTRLAWNG
jgi:hypothetical protein